jgi:holo-[acyl-carrier protein] synthase
MVDVGEVAASLARFGDRYARRVFSADELALWPGAVPVRACTDLAERFAAKEATIKVLAPGDQGLDWRSIEVRRQGRAGCSVRLSGAAATLAQEAGIGRVTLSVSSAGGVAMAVAIGSGNGSGRPGPVEHDNGEIGKAETRKAEIRKDGEA